MNACERYIDLTIAADVDADLLTLDVDKTILLDIPLDCIELFILKKPGDFSIVKTPQGKFYLCILAGENPAKKTTERMVSLQIEKNGREVGISGMLFCRAESIGKMLYKFNNSPMNVLSGVLDERISFRRLVGRQALREADIYTSSCIFNQQINHSDLNFLYYSAEMNTRTGIRKVMLMSPAQMTSNDFHNIMFEEMRMKLVVQKKNLPIRCPIGIILDKPMIVQELTEGYSMEYFLQMYLCDLDIPARMKLCGATIRVMSILHNNNIFHGGVQASNFYLYTTDKNGLIELSVVFSGSDGLVPTWKKKHVTSVNFDMYAPEVAWTRTLTPASGVYSVGRLFSRILETDLEINQSISDNVMAKMKRIIQSACVNNPDNRPTMDGIVCGLNEILPQIEETRTKYRVKTNGER